jgi:hypothetical protein
LPWRCNRNDNACLRIGREATERFPDVCLAGELVKVVGSISRVEQRYKGRYIPGFKSAEVPAVPGLG